MDSFSAAPRRRRRNIHLTTRDLAVLELLVIRRVETIDFIHERVFTGLSRKRALNRLGELIAAGYLKRTFADLPGADEPRSVYWLTVRAANALKLRSASGSEWLATRNWRLDLDAPSIPHQIVTNRVCDWLGAQAIPEHLLEPADRSYEYGRKPAVRHRPDAVYRSRGCDGYGRELVYVEVDMGHYSRKRIIEKIDALHDAREARFLLFACPTEERVSQVCRFIRERFGCTDIWERVGVETFKNLRDGWQPDRFDTLPADLLPCRETPEPAFEL